MIDGTVPAPGALGRPDAAGLPRCRSCVAAVEAAAAAGTLDAATDCASLVEASRRARAPGRVPTDPNLKVTTPADMALAEALLGALSRIPAAC